MNLAERLIESCGREVKRVAVVGDAMVDVYIRGEVRACQDGCPKFVEEGRRAVPGGAANAVRSLEHWPAEAHLITPWARGLSDEDVDDGLCFCCPRRYIPHKHRFVGADGQVAFRHDVEAPAYGRLEYQLERWREEAMQSLSTRRFDAVLISDYDKGWMTPEFVRGVAERCRERRVPCVADAKREPAVYAGAILKCNAEYQPRYNRELSELVYDGTGSLVVTDGPSNPMVWDAGELVRGFPFLPPVPLINHVGAGDCFGAHLALALACGFALKDAAAVAHSAGRAYVCHPYNRPPRPGEVAADMAGAAPGGA